MTKADILIMLEDVSDDAEILVQSEHGFISACMTDTGKAEDPSGMEIFVIMPCYCHFEEEDETIEVNVQANDFDINNN